MDELLKEDLDAAGDLLWKARQLLEGVAPKLTRKDDAKCPNCRNARRWYSPDNGQVVTCPVCCNERGDLKQGK